MLLQLPQLHFSDKGIIILILIPNLSKLFTEYPHDNIVQFLYVYVYVTKSTYTAKAGACAHTRALPWPSYSNKWVFSLLTNLPIILIFLFHNKHCLPLA